MDPVQFLLDNKDAVLKAYETGNGPKGAWNILCNQIPELPDTMKYNSFKQYSTPFVKISLVLNVENEALKADNETLKAENNRLKHELETSKKKPVIIAQKDAQQRVEQTDTVKNIIGWTIVKRNPKNPKHSAVYDAKRRIQGKSISVYIGKEVNVDIAVKKIRKKEQELKKAGLKLTDLQKSKNEHIEQK